MHILCSNSCSVLTVIFDHCYSAPLPTELHCKSKKVALTNLGYLSCSFTTKQCAYIQADQLTDMYVSNFRQHTKN